MSAGPASNAPEHAYGTAVAPEESAESADALTRRQAALDLAVLAGVSALNVLSVVLRIPKRYTIPVIVVFVVAYVAKVLLPRGESARAFGFRTDNLKRALAEAAVVTAAGAAGMIGFALATGKPVWRPELAWLLPLYPLWGVVQQLVFQGIGFRRLLYLLPERKGLAVLLGAALFASVHLADFRLTGLTFVAGLTWSGLYLRAPNLWALGLSHGVLASLAYPILLGENLLLRV